MDLFDNFMGFMNWLRFPFGIMNRAIHPSKGGRFGATVRIRVPRCDKGGNEPVLWIRDHLHRYHIPTFDHNFDANYHYFRVRKTQYKWAMWLIGNEGQHMQQPKRTWGNQRKTRSQR